MDLPPIYLAPLVVQGIHSVPSPPLEPFVPGIPRRPGIMEKAKAGIAQSQYPDYHDDLGSYVIAHKAKINENPSHDIGMRYTTTAVEGH